MLTLGISGGFDLIDQRRTYLVPDGACHDSAAVLLEDGRVVAAVEEERLNRIKHTNKAPVKAIKYCLEQRGITVDDLDALAFYGSEECCARVLNGIFYSTVDAQPVVSVRELIHQFLREGVGSDIDDRKLVFINHHLAHAASASLQSGFSEALVFTADGAGDFLCGTIGTWRDSAYQLLRSLPVSHSLGNFYDAVIAILGYEINEEYKVMGLAPYGNTDRFRPAFRQVYELLPEGQYAIHWDRVEHLYALTAPRKKGEAILQEHIDLAAALQESLEQIVFHVLTWFQSQMRLPNLCMAGGVAHNSTLNGKLLSSGMFQEIFVHPASHDAGCAVGAALCAEMALSPLQERVRIEDVFWGPPLCNGDMLKSELDRWRELIEIEFVPDICARAADLLADGNVIGWVQGRSEFGPRALGNRSILADPRPAENKTIVNQLIKKRENYRPFAPSVMEEYALDYFEIPTPGMTLPFMSFTVQVKVEKREVLGAVTHVDNTARLQTVSQKTNPRFWELIDEFRKLTGVPVLLNTSFNNNVEPIVDSVADAVASYLTTGLHYLVIGNYLISKKPDYLTRLLRLAVELPEYGRLVKTKSHSVAGNNGLSHAITNSFSPASHEVSHEVYELMMSATGAPVATLLNGTSTTPAQIAGELFELWQKRAIVLRPVCNHHEDLGLEG